MNKWWYQSIKYLLLLSFIIPLLAACAVSDTVKEQYPLESVNGSGNQTSYVYRAENRPVPDVAADFIDQRNPKQQSDVSTERMFLVYSDEIIHLQQAPDAPEDTLIEIDSTEYVRQNYSSSFLQAYLIASVLDDIFDKGKYGSGKYRGYSSKDKYKPSTTYRMPTVEDKKVAPPATVNRTGSIFKRSKDAGASTTGTTSSGSQKGSGTDDNKQKNSITTKPPAKGKIVKDKKQKSSSNKVYTKPRTSKPSVKFGKSRITRRR
ncbi:DUF4247 domain-containing protein [Bacillus sp. FJAT-26390]|uniref:DUF4247 domain-containing protein n=1 Tax=Bacillus sp. FJAT-26390 TaxID=1743142 RepID=UPI00080811F7|nr:DUF4247 domain-containing protein [Bacillus sp. FJAT-26390]OBZ10315.1 hypothetical protein A7975_23490 [Bacillus sp. FJAT-26390]